MPAAADGETAGDLRPELGAPGSVQEALQAQDGLEGHLGERTAAELETLLDAWLALARSQQGAIDDALAAPEGSPERDAAVTLRSDLDALLAGATTIAEALAAAGGDAARARAEIDALRPDEEDVLEASTVPPSRASALALPVEVLAAQLRPLRRDQVAEQLEQWLAFLQKTCLEVRNVEISTLESRDPAQVEAFSARAVVLRGERAALIERVEVVIAALESKGGEVAEARAYVDSVVLRPRIAGWRAAWATARAWCVDASGGIAVLRGMLVAAAILVASWFLSRVLGALARRALGTMQRASGLLREFLMSTVRRLTLLVGILIALSTLGVDMTPLVAAIGAAGLVIGLALQGTLSNLASGLMIMIYRPFDQGDVVDVAGSVGTVDGMTLMTTTVRTFDNQTIHVPNNKIWGDVIKNVTANPTRRVDLVFGIGYGDDVERAKAILERVVRAHPKVLAEPAPVIRLHELGDSSVNLVVRPWARTGDYWEVHWDLTEAVKRAFDAEGITIPFPQRDVHLIPAPPAGRDGPASTPAEEPGTLRPAPTAQRLP